VKISKLRSCSLRGSLRGPGKAHCSGLAEPVHPEGLARTRRQDLVLLRGVGSHLQQLNDITCRVHPWHRRSESVGESDEEAACAPGCE
jgi:hypothetical protein